MKDASRANPDSIEDVLALKKRIHELEKSVEESRRSQEALRQEYSFLKAIIDNSRDVIWTVGMDMRLTYVSPSVTKLLGFTVEEAMARTMQQAYTPESFEQAMQIFTEEMAIESDGHADPTRSRRLELELFCKDGNTIPAEGNFSFLRDQTGKAIAILAIMRDITERRKVAEALKTEQRRLQQALDEVRTLRGIVPICAYCKKIRDDDGYWSQVEQYISDHTDAKFSHGICPACYEKEMKELKS